jgi:predicted glycoside hydrolase/deacetylase ChbG (UPF0249 family)
LIETEEKRVVICADDFGMNSAIDGAIIHLGELGRLNATSCLTQGPSFVQGALALRQSMLFSGLHLNFTERLGEDDGLYMPIGALIRRAWLRRLDPDVVRTQIIAQLDGFEAHMLRAPDFVDGHQHVHQFPVIRECLLQVLTHRYGDRRPWLRATVAPALTGLAWPMRYKANVIEVLGARRLHSLSRAQGYVQNPYFLGVYDFQGGSAAYARLMQQWLGLARSGDLIMCHPATGAVAGDVLGKQRQAEYEVLSSTAMAAWMLQQGIVMQARCS